MKIYLWSLLLSLSLGAIEIPLHGSVSAYNTNFFYIDTTSLKSEETINIQVSYDSYNNYCSLEYKRSNYYDDAEYSDEFERIDYSSYSSDSYNIDYYYSLSKDSFYNYILLKLTTYYYFEVPVTIYYNKPNYTWVIWLVIIIIIIIICIIIFVFLYLKRKKTAKALADSSHQPTVNDNQPPVNAYQPPVYEPQPPQDIQQS